MPFRRGLARSFRIIFKEKRHVFEKREHAKIHQKARSNKDPPHDGVFRRLQSESEKVIATGRDGDQRQVPHVPFGVEKIVREQEHAEGERSQARQGPVQKKDGCQEDEVRRRGKKQ